MIVKGYLTVNSRGTMKITRKMTGVGFDEVAIALELNLPNTLFQKPRLQANITVPSDAVSPQLITAEVADNITNAIKSAAGMDVEITIINPKSE